MFECAICALKKKLMRNHQTRRCDSYAFLGLEKKNAIEIWLLEIIFYLLFFHVGLKNYAFVLKDC